MAGRPRLAPSLKEATPADYYFPRPLGARQQLARGLNKTGVAGRVLKKPHAHLPPSALQATKLDPSSLPDPLAPLWMMDKPGQGSHSDVKEAVSYQPLAFSQTKFQSSNLSIIATALCCS
ncbi:MAG TPA: hypothetical protein VGO96_10590 [Pyrinomonadaceae bacterium]|jgi:hypothetical protein|nr:hypothetical protein [Pyrinomonadaceae bacterium]